MLPHPVKRVNQMIAMIGEMIDEMARRLDFWVVQAHQPIDVSGDETPVPWCRLCRCAWHSGQHHRTSRQDRV